MRKIVALLLMSLIILSAVRWGDNTQISDRANVQQYTIDGGGMKVSMVSFSFLIGVNHLRMGYLRRLKGKTLISYEDKFESEKDKRLFTKIVGKFDIIYGIILIVFGIYMLNQPFSYSILIILTIIVIVAMTILNFLKRKYNLNYL